MTERQTKIARRLRRDQTDAERLLWSRLRAGQLAGFKFRRQVPIDRYFADFACIEAKLIVELDGGQHSDAIDYDANRTLALEQAGFVVLRFWNSQVYLEIEGVLEEILIALRIARP